MSFCIESIGILLAAWLRSRISTNVKERLFSGQRVTCEQFASTGSAHLFIFSTAAEGKDPERIVLSIHSFQTAEKSKEVLQGQHPK